MFKLTNGVAERGVKLIQIFTSTINYEEYLQYIMESNRKKVDSLSKTALMNLYHCDLSYLNLLHLDLDLY